VSSFCEKGGTGPYGVTYTETGFQLYGCENHRQSLRLKSQSSLDAVSMLLAFSDFVFYFFVV